jgi:cytochrome d ubiquinol oxidase subunit I
MAFSLGWHIILACFGMTFPAMIFVAHRKGLRGDEVALTLAKRWSKVAGVLFAIGAVSGTVLSFEMGLLWPGLMETYGDVIGLAFALEGISFFTEAIFLGIYIYSWDRIDSRLQSWMLVPIMIAGVTGSFLVISVNAWMNAPTGFDLLPDGTVTNVDPVAAIFNSAAGLQFLHMYLAAVMVSGFMLASVYSFGLLKGYDDRLHRLAVLIPLAFAAPAAMAQPMVGHYAGQRLADEQPIKLAAMEGLATTTDSARVELGGYWNGEELVGAIEVPVDGLLSFIATNDFDATVIGLDAVPEEDQPPVGVVHIAFQVMVALGTALMGLAVWFAVGYWRRRDRLLDSRWFTRALLPAGPAAIVAMEAGWITTEVGRQPWVVHEILRTEDAVTDANYIWFTFITLVVVYALMTVGAIAVLRSMWMRWRSGEEAIAPYGPTAEVGADR